MELLLSDHLKCDEFVVAYENRPTGGLLREEVPGHLIFCQKKKLLHAVDDMCGSMLIVFIKISSYIPSSVVQECEHKDRAMNQAVFYRKLITMITIKLSSGRSRHKSCIL